VRAVSLSNPRVISLLNGHYVPVYASNEDYGDRGSAAPDEKAAVRDIFREGYEKKMSVGSVHAYVIGPDGHLIDSMHTVDVAKPDKLVAMLEGAVAKLGTPPGKPVVQPKPQPGPQPGPDELVLQLTARYLERRGAELALVENAGGNWSALPSEDSIVLSKAEWSKLLPPPPSSSVGSKWTVDPELTRSSSSISIRRPKTRTSPRTRWSPPPSKPLSTR
jgi:hypothetical protein